MTRAVCSVKRASAVLYTYMSDTPVEFQVVKFFSEFNRLVEKTDVYPIDKHNFVIHKDLVHMLGGDEMEFYYPAASLVMDRPRSFQDLLFSVELYNTSFMIGIDQQQPIQVEYARTGMTESDLARELVALLCGLANGQIFLLMTTIGDEGQAVEFLYKQKGADMYTVARTFTFFGKASKQPDAEYETTVRRNDAEIPEQMVNGLFLESVLPQTIAEAESDRRPFSDLNAPLTRELHKKRADEVTELWSQDYTAGWFPGYKKSSNTGDKLVAYTYYRYVETIAVVVLAILLLTLHERTVTENVIRFILLALGTVISCIYLRNGGKLTWLYGAIAYLAALAYGGIFMYLQPTRVWEWIVAILAFEPIVEMIIADIYRLLKRRTAPVDK